MNGRKSQVLARSIGNKECFFESAMVLLSCSVCPLQLAGNGPTFEDSDAGMILAGRLVKRQSAGGRGRLVVMLADALSFFAFVRLVFVHSFILVRKRMKQTSMNTAIAVVAAAMTEGIRVPEGCEFSPERFEVSDKSDIGNKGGYVKSVGGMGVIGGINGDGGEGGGEGGGGEGPGRALMAIDASVASETGSPIF